MTTRLLFLHALSPLHAGTGQSNGAIELAIARERSTGFPYLPGSSLKGSLRARAYDEARDKTVPIFGPDTANASDHAGALMLGDANLLLMPARSVAGTFAWVTSPYLLQRFARDAQEAGLVPIRLPDGPSSVDKCYIGEASNLVVGHKPKRVIFEDLDFQPGLRPEIDPLAAWLGEHVFPGDNAWQKQLAQRLCVVHDDAMGFLSRHATDVVTRVALEHDTKTVRQGALWREESLPSESVLVALAHAAPNKRTGLTGDAIFDVLAQLTVRSLQLGGKATVGRGRCRVVIQGGAA